MLLIEKSAHLRSHAGQPAFPGGGVDPGDDYPVGTALREAEEEAGIDPAGVRVLATLQELFLPPSDRLVVPVVGWWDDPRDVTVGDPREVARVARVPLADLADPANRFRVRHPSGYVGPAFARRRHGGLGLHRRPARRDPRGRRPGPAVGRPRRPAAAGLGASGPYTLPGSADDDDDGRRRRADGRRSRAGRPSDAYGSARDDGRIGSRIGGAAGCCSARCCWRALLAGCGGDGPRPPPAPTTAAGVGTVTTAADGVQEITLQTQDDYVFTPDHFTVGPGHGAADRGQRRPSR